MGTPGVHPLYYAGPPVLFLCLNMMLLAAEIIQNLIMEDSGLYFRESILVKYEENFRRFLCDLANAIYFTVQIFIFSYKELFPYAAKIIQK